MTTPGETRVTSAAAAPTERRRRPLSKSLLLWTRTLHIYATMLALIVLMFFSFTGFVMNHPAVFGIDKPKDQVEKEVTLPAALAGDTSADHKLHMVEYLRANQGARGELSAYEEDEGAPIHVQFTGPGRKSDFWIERMDGKTKVSGDAGNVLALMSDLHKGVGSGEAWRRVIDATAIFLMFASLSGLVLWISLPKRRTLGIVALVVGLGLCAGVYFLLVP